MLLIIRARFEPVSLALRELTLVLVHGSRELWGGESIEGEPVEMDINTGAPKGRRAEL